MARKNQRRNWAEIIEKLNASSGGYMKIKMGSPGSAQVTRCRLLEEWNGLEAWTDGAMLHLKVDK